MKIFAYWNDQERWIIGKDNVTLEKLSVPLWRVGRGREPWERSEAGGVIGNERHLHRPRSVPTALGPAPLVTATFILLLVFITFKLKSRALTRSLNWTSNQSSHSCQRPQPWFNMLNWANYCQCESSRRELTCGTHQTNYPDRRFTQNMFLKAEMQEMESRKMQGLEAQV